MGLKHYVLGLLVVACTASTALAQIETRVLSIGGTVTEIIYQLGQQHRLVARDSTSMFPPTVLELPNVGYKRQLSAEGALSVDPELIIAEDDSGPPETIDVLTAAGIPFVQVPDDYTVESVATKIHIVGLALGVSEEAAALAKDVTADINDAVDRAKAAAVAPKRVMFVLSAANGRIMASGTGTAADGIIQLAGGINAVSGFTGYKPLTDEAITLAAPDVVLMMDRGGSHSLSAADLFAIPTMALTPAAETGALVKMDGLLLLGFGPRTGQAVTQLSQALYSER